MDYKLEEVNCYWYDDLYDILKERDETINISHKKMPTFEEHCSFWKNKPYKFARIIVVDDDFAGYCYLTEHNEIGIFVKKEFQGNGLAKRAIKEMMSTFWGRKNKRFLANINPRNEKSKKLFESLGFKICQVTYEFCE